MSLPSPDSLVGTMLDGRYVVRGFLAKGGMASVFIAMDTRLDREVALKVMRPDLADDDAFVARFRREARAAARLSHPHVVGVFDQGRDGPHVFLAMELVRGRTLREVIRTDGPLTARAALDILDPVLQALGAAHRADTVHRDVKPENVLIGDDGMVKVADFGLARALTTETLTTNHDVLLGTAAYLAPEQVEHGHVDKRSDVYAATLLLHEMLTGQKAFAGDSPIHVAYQHVHGDVPRPGSVLPGIPPELDALVALGAAKDPEVRPDDALAMVHQVRATRGQLTGEQLDRLPHGAHSGADEAYDTLGLAGSTRALSGRSTEQFGRRGGSHAPTRPTAMARPGHPKKTPSKATAADRRAPRRAAWWAAVAVALLAVSGVGWWFGIGPGSAVAVPEDLQGKAQGQAISALESAGLSAQIDEVFSETVPKGRVVSSNPGSGSDQRKSEPVVLRVSRGPDRATVPALAGQSRPQATATLKKERLALGKVSEAYDEKVATGQVISSSPTRGDQVKPKTAVNVVISKGRQPIPVPNLQNQTEAAATKQLTDLGLKVEQSDPQFHDSVPKGSVISASPAAGTVYKGDTITVTLSKGPKLVKVPNVLNKSTNEARTTLEKAGFKVEVSRFLGGVLDTVRGQTPSGGTEVRKGTTIKLTVV